MQAKFTAMIWNTVTAYCVILLILHDDMEGIESDFTNVRNLITCFE